MNKSESITKLAISLAKFNGEVSSISKDAKNPFFKSNYVTLDKLIIETRELLQKHGLSIMQFPLSKDTGEIGIQTLLLHESGEFIETEPLFMKPQKNDPQQAGSVITYLRRYSYQAILSLNTGEDDDGNKSTYGNSKPNTGAKNSVKTQTVQVINAEQLKVMFDLAKGKDIEQVKQIIHIFGFMDSKQITVDKYQEICNKIKEL